MGPRDTMKNLTAIATAVVIGEICVLAFLERFLISSKSLDTDTARNPHQSDTHYPDSSCPPLIEAIKF